MLDLGPPDLRSEVVDQSKRLSYRWSMWFDQLYKWLTSIYMQNVTVDFGGTPASSASTTVVGQQWVTTQSKIVANVLCPTGVSAATFEALGLHVVISDIATGTFKVTVFTTSPATTTGEYSVSIVGAA